MGDSSHKLVCRAGDVLVALPLGQVVEVMRPLPLQMVRSGVPFVTGVAVIRGEPVPVVDLCSLLSEHTNAPVSRFMRVRLSNGRHLALAVSEVLGVRSLGPETFAAFPPLLRSGALEFASALGALDREVLLILETGRILPDNVLRELEAS